MKYKILLPLFLHGTVTAATVQLTNGDFSSGTDPVATGWTRTQGSGSNGSGDSNYAETIPNLASRSMQLKSDGDNFVQQTLSLTDLDAMDATTFGNFTVGFDYGYRRDAVTNGDHTLRVSLWNVTDNVELAGQDIFIADPGIGTNSLTSGSYNLIYNNTSGTLTGDSIAVRFTSISGDLEGNAWQRTAFIDNIAITAVPEPAAALLGSLGILGLLRRRR